MRVRNGAAMTTDIDRLYRAVEQIQTLERVRDELEQELAEANARAEKAEAENVRLKGDINGLQSHARDYMDKNERQLKALEAMCSRILDIPHKSGLAVSIAIKAVEEAEAALEEKA